MRFTKGLLLGLNILAIIFHPFLSYLNVLAQNHNFFFPFFCNIDTLKNIEIVDWIYNKMCV